MAAMKRRPSKQSVGRPTKLTPDRVERLLKGLKANMTRVGASALAGISERAFHDWMRESREPDASEELRNFRSAVLEAEAIGELSLVVDVKRDDPKWLLSRRYTRWADRPAEAKVTHQGPSGQALTMFSDEQLTKLLTLLGVEDESGGADERGA